MKHATACAHCGLIMELLEEDMAYECRCARCHSLIYRPGKAFGFILPILFTTIIFFALSLSVPLLDIRIGDFDSKIMLLKTMIQFFKDGYVLVGIVALLGGIVIPLLLMGLLLVVMLSVGHKRHSSVTLFCFRFYQQLREWGMVEVYLASVLVTIIKLKNISILSYESGLIFFAVYLISFYVVCIWFNPQDIWNQNNVSD